MPPIPGWDGIHPLIIHFPIALLLAVPVLLLAALLVPRHAFGLAVGAFLLMLMGTVAAMMAISSGEAAAEIAERTPGVNAILEQHEELAELVRNVFIALTVIFAVALFLPALRRKEWNTGLRVSSLAIMLLLTLGGDVLIANTAHHGGRLVHEFGVHAIVASSGSNTAAPAATQNGEDED